MIIECVICYEHLQSSEAIYHTPCGHVFHHPCLTKWFERSKTCPECREKVAETAIRRIYLHFSSDNADDVSTTLQTEIAGLNHEVLIKELEIIESNSNNARLSALLKIKESEIGGLITAAWIAKKNNRVWKNTVETQRKELDAAKGDIARLVKERDESINSSNAHWEEISRMFYGIKDHGTLVEIISLMKKQMEENLATLEIEKIVLQKRIDDLEAMLISNGTLGHTSHRTIEEVDAYISAPTKKLKIDTTTESSSGNASVSSGPIDVIDLTKDIVQPLIDLTDTDTVELPLVNEIDMSWPLAS